MYFFYSHSCHFANKVFSVYLCNLSQFLLDRLAAGYDFNDNDSVYETDAEGEGKSNLDYEENGANADLENINHQMKVNDSRSRYYPNWWDR